MLLCRRKKLFTDGIVAIDGSKFKAVNNRDKNLTDRKLQARFEQLEDGIRRYLVELDRADRDATAVLPGRVAPPEAMKLRRQTVEHVFGTLKSWMGSRHFLTRTLPRVRTEMSLQVLAFNLKRTIRILGAGPLMAAMNA